MEQMEPMKYDLGEGLGSVTVTFREPRTQDILELDKYKKPLQEVRSIEDGKEVVKYVNAPSQEETFMGCVLLLEVNGKPQPREWWEERKLPFYNACVAYVADGITRVNKGGESGDPLTSESS